MTDAENPTNDADAVISPAVEKTKSSHDNLADPFQPREGRDLVWKDVNMTLTAEKKSEGTDKKILDDVWGEVPQRQVTAIMGPSGSGKSSLLNVLAGRASTGGRIVVDADVRLNNYTVDPTNIEIRQKIAFVAQDDSLQVTSTPREAIRFSAKLRLSRDLTDAQLDRLTATMLRELGLVDCADTLVGGDLLKGISGGERKRTAVGVELVTRPALVFLDEPTSGLDSFNAVKLCEVLSKVANAGSSVLFTIHQPSSEIFQAFDRLILLNKGKVMYQGPSTEASAYFEGRGHPCPPAYNPADHIMNVALAVPFDQLVKDSFFPRDERAIGDAFVADENSGRDVLGVTNQSGDGNTMSLPPGFAVQTKLLLEREFTNLARSPTAIKSRTIMSLAISLFIGCLFYDIGNSDFSEFINVQSAFGGLLMALMANIFATAIPSLVAFPEERPVFLREYSTNHYSVASYFMSRLFIELLITASQVTLSSLITYFMCGFHANFGIYWSALYIMACASTALGVMVGSAVENPNVAIEFLPALFMPQILFSGFFVAPDQIPDFLEWIRYICPLTYGVWIVVADEFEGGRCDDVVEKDPTIKNHCVQVMDNIDAEQDDAWWNYLVLLSLFAFVRLVALRILTKKASKFY